MASTVLGARFIFVVGTGDEFKSVFAAFVRLENGAPVRVDLLVYLVLASAAKFLTFDASMPLSSGCPLSESVCVGSFVPRADARILDKDGPTQGANIV